MNKSFKALVAFLFIFTFTACDSEEDQPDNLQYDVSQTDVSNCSYTYEGYTGDEIIIQDVTIENASVFGDEDLFINPCSDNDNPIVLAESRIRSYKMKFTFDNIYPIEEVNITNFLEDDTMNIQSIDVYVSLDGVSFEKIKDEVSLNTTGEKETIITLDDVLAREVKIMFSSEINTGNNGSEFFALSNIEFITGTGFIVQEADIWTELFNRKTDWSGADGIFSYNLETGNNTIGTDSSSTLFVFSDTMIGDVNDKGLRQYQQMINNSIAYYDGSANLKDGTTFHYKENNSLPASVFIPDEFIGYEASNLINQMGILDYYNPNSLLDTTVKESSWLSSSVDNEKELVFDFKDAYDLSKLYIYNFTDDIDLGAKNITISYSLNNSDWTVFSEEVLEQASNQDQIEHSLISENDFLDLTGVHARYIKITIDSNYANTTQSGLSKVMFFADEKWLYASVEASSKDETIAPADHPRLWLGDGVVIGDYWYNFPMLVKDYDGFFKVFKVHMVKVPIVNNKLDIEQIEYLDAPLLQETIDGSLTIFGGGVLNQDSSGHAINQDGYIYIYGYKDNPGRQLVVARVEEEYIEDFNKWTYFNGESFVEDQTQIVGLIDGVSPEFSVTYIPSGMFEGKYMLTVMEGTTSGMVSISFSDTPWGPFTPWTQIYETYPVYDLPGAFSYNAKMHSHLSEEGRYLISYNVNTSSASALQRVDIYRPRFIWLTETKER